MDERVRFLALLNESDEPFAALCRQFGISRKTGYTWVERYEQHGPAGLHDRPPVAHGCPHRTPEPLVRALCELRKQHPTWGPKKLRARLEGLGHAALPAPSTLGALLKTHGLIRPRRRRAYPPPDRGPLAPAPRPNDTWCVDVKGHFALGNRTRCHPLTATDQATRYLLCCEALARPDERSVRPQFERLFHAFGLPRRIRSDNGPPFATAGFGGLSSLSVWRVKLGITPERIEPGCPGQNGRHERMHRTLKQEAAEPPGADLLAQQGAFDRFRRVYDELRPHEALGQATPASRYHASGRPMPATARSPTYDRALEVRVLAPNGRLAWRGAQGYVTKLLAGEPVGLAPLDDAHARLFYGPLLVGEVRRRGTELELRKARDAGP